MAPIQDTSAEAEAVQLGLLRSKSLAERGALAIRLSTNLIRAAKQAIRRARPTLTEAEVAQVFVELHYGPELAAAVRRHQAEHK